MYHYLNPLTFLWENYIIMEAEMLRKQVKILCKSVTVKPDTCIFDGRKSVCGNRTVSERIPKRTIPLSACWQRYFLRNEKDSDGT